MPSPQLQTPDDVDVVFALTGNVRKNSRALRQLRALAGSGLRILVISVASEPDSSIGIPNAHFHAIRPPTGGGARYFWLLHRKFTKLAFAFSPRVYHASDLYALPSLNSAAERHDAKLVYDARELYAHVVATVGRPWVRQFWKQVEQHFIRKADAVFTVSDGIADRLADDYEIRRPTVIHNVPERGNLTRRSPLHETDTPSDDDLLRSHARPEGQVGTRVRLRSQPIILHLGQMRPHRGCEILVDVMRDIENAVLVFLGDGPLREPLRLQAIQSHIEGRVHFLDPVPPNQVVAYTQSATVGVTLLDDVCLNHHLALPNKLFEYLTAGVPVIASDLPEIRKVVREYDVGQVVRPGKRDDLVAALKQALLDRSLRERWQKNIPRVLETFNWERASHDFLRVYRELLRDP